MIPRGLATAIVVGVVAGAVFGAGTVWLRGPDSLEFVEGPSISIVTNGTDFKRGDEIQIALVNSGTVLLTLPEGYLRVTQLDGIEVYTTPTQTEQVLGPGERILLEWDQRKNDGEAALYGTYKMVSKALSGSAVVGDSVSINIFK